uniref:Uncharacterized protein n=1 Tax=Lymantria dispar multicapsid nuclear polyhedrosis virus TaxID=10449 RepID=A0A140HR45_NPVLD|nr:hypothetical protein [Lymantria dispar multiple nucleopolyhedrovirus]
MAPARRKTPRAPAGVAFRSRLSARSFDLLGQAIVEYGRARAATTFVAVDAHGARVGAGR